MEHRINSRRAHSHCRSKPDLIQWTNVNLVNLGNSTRIINKTSEQICQAGLNMTLLVFPYEMFSESEDICKQHNGKMLTGSVEDNVRPFLVEINQVLIDRCDGEIWIEKINDTKSPGEFGKPQSQCKIYSITQQQRLDSSCDNNWCFVCVLPLERSIFKLQTKSQMITNLGTDFTFLNNEYGNLVYLGSSGWSYINSWAFYSRQNSNWTVLAERNYSGSSLPGVLNLIYRGTAENNSTQAVQIKITNVSNTSLTDQNFGLICNAGIITHSMLIKLPSSTAGNTFLPLTS